MSDTEELQALVYVSSARTLMNAQALEELLQRAQANNSKEGVTGVLLYCDGNFMQYLEGPPDAVARVGARIRVDPRHHSFFEIDSSRIRTRAFSGWTMAYLPVHKADFVQLSRGDWKTDSDGPAGLERPLGLSLLLDFWDRHQRIMSSVVG